MEGQCSAIAVLLESGGGRGPAASKRQWQWIAQQRRKVDMQTFLCGISKQHSHASPCCLWPPTLLLRRRAASPARPGHQAARHAHPEGRRLAAAGAGASCSGHRQRRSCCGRGRSGCTGQPAHPWQRPQPCCQPELYRQLQPGHSRRCPCAAGGQLGLPGARWQRRVWALLTGTAAVLGAAGAHAPRCQGGWVPPVGAEQGRWQAWQARANNKLRLPVVDSLCSLRTTPMPCQPACRPPAAPCRPLPCLQVKQSGGGSGAWCELHLIAQSLSAFASPPPPPPPSPPSAPLPLPQPVPLAVAPKAAAPTATAAAEPPPEPASAGVPPATPGATCPALAPAATTNKPSPYAPISAISQPAAPVPPAPAAPKGSRPTWGAAKPAAPLPAMEGE